MNRASRRTVLAALASLGTTGLGGCLGMDSGGGSDGREILDGTYTPASDGNPVVQELDVDPGAVLEVDATYEEGTALAVVHGDSGAVLATSGVGEVPDGETVFESEPLPESTAPNALVLSMHETDQVDVTVTAVAEQSPTGVSAGVTDAIETLAAAIEPERADRRTVELVGPAWLWLFETVLTAVTDTSPGPELDRAVESVYGALARHEAERWVGTSVGTVAGALGTGAAGAVQSATGLPGFIVEDALQDSIEEALGSGPVSWRYGDPKPGALDVTGGEVTVTATFTAELTVSGAGVALEAPLELLVGVDGDTVPAVATVEDHEVLVDDIEVEPA